MSKYQDKSLADLRKDASTRELLANGTSGAGGGTWRAGATKPALIAALEAHDEGRTIEAAVTVPGASASGDINALAAALASFVPKPTLDEDAIRRIVRETVSESGAIQVDVRRHDGTVKHMGRQHAKFAEALAWLSLGENVLLVGPAGSGKTTAARSLADALGRDFESFSVGPQTTQAGIMGFIDAHGNYVPSAFARCYRNGKLCLIDEWDAGGSGVNTITNSALDNGHASFPDAHVERHPDFLCIASANTYGMGANRVYVGRQQQDGAAGERFVVVDWPYDEPFERDLALAHAAAIDASSEVAAKVGAWVSQVQTWRAKADTLGIRHIISPRASIRGAKAIAAGVLSQEQIENAVVFKGLDDDSRKRVKS